MEKFNIKISCGGKMLESRSIKSFFNDNKILVDVDCDNWNSINRELWIFMYKRKPGRPTLKTKSYNSYKSVIHFPEGDDIYVLLKTRVQIMHRKRWSYDR